MSTWPFNKLRLRSKLLLISLTILLLPWFGIQYIKVVENLLQQQQALSIATIAKASATIVEQYPKLLQQRADVYQHAISRQKSTVSMVNTPILIDGYNDDWLESYSLLQPFSAKNQLNHSQSIDPQTLSARYIFALQSQSVKLFLDVVDDDVKLRKPHRTQRHGGDAVILAITDNQQRNRRYILATSAPGNVNAYEYIGNYLEPVIVRAEPLIKAAWQMSAYGYRLEVSLPISMLAGQVAISVVDIDGNEKSAQVIGLGDVNDRMKFNQLLLPSKALTNALAKMVREGERLWLVDRQQVKFASAGYGDIVIEQDNLHTALDWFYQLFLTPPVSDDESITHEQLIFSGETVKSALAGLSKTERYQANNNSVMLVASYPVYVDGEVVAAVVAEKNTNAILAVQNEAMKELLNTTMLVLLIVVVILFGFASRLSLRIHRLNRDIANAVNSDGRVSDFIDKQNEYDELAELRQNFAQLFKRLGLYNHYLEALASRLSHEIRTPIAVIKTSLEHVETYIDEDGKKYVDRARIGSDRINDIVLRMSEASRLEQTVSSIEFIEFDLQELMTNIFQAYQDIYPKVNFQLNASKEVVLFWGSPELIAQMIDKLISNAVDFHDQKSQIEVSVVRNDTTCIIGIKNSGQPLPEGLELQLFQPMVSKRSHNEHDQTPHLGLGLYIVKLITDRHKGLVRATNWQQGVEISVELPIVRP